MQNVRTLLLLGLLALWACSSSKPPSNTIEVQHFGTLRQMMHQGDISPQADLKNLENTPHLYALGALAELKGEVLIWDGKPIIAQAHDWDVRIDHSFNHKATLLVLAQVEDWSPQSIPDSVQDYAQLEQYIEKAAAQLGLSTDQPFPIKLKSKVAWADWHVINWAEGDTVHTHRKHQTSGPHGRLTDLELDILGFYSKHHHGVFTHHSSNLHIHAKTNEDDWAAHVDDLGLSSGALLYLPKP